MLTMKGKTKNKPKLTPKNKKKVIQKTTPKAVKHRMNYSSEQMQKAIEAVKNGMSCSQASRKYEVPRITLMYKVQGKFKDKKCGRESYLNSEEESRLVDWIVTMGKAGFPVTKTELLDSVQKLVKDLKTKNPEREFPFAGDRPGRHWYESFLRRNPTISVRTAQNLTSSRANVTEEKLRQWHAEVTNYLTENNWSNIVKDPKRVFNADEAAFFLNPKGNKVLFSRGEKCVYSIVNNDEKECLTVMVCGNAFGDVCPSMIVFKYERIPQDIVENIPSDWGVGRSENGWMTTGVFYEFIANIFYPWLLRQNITLPIILFIDGHSSHLSLHTSQFCQEHKIILVALYPNATHIIQPMDVAVFRTLKSAWKEEVHKWRLSDENMGKELKKRNFAPLLEKAIQKTVTSTVVSNGFKKCGLFPWDSEAINFKQNPKHEVKSTPSQENKSPNKTSEDSDRRKKLQVALSVIEEEIGHKNLKNFKENEFNMNWAMDINIENHALFQVWKNIRAKSESLDSSLVFEGLLPVITDIDVSLNDISLTGLEGIEILASEPTEEELSLQPASSSPVVQDKNQEPEPQQSLHSETVSDSYKDKEVDIETTTTKMNKPDASENNIPSPFKRALVYPEEKTMKKKKKLKEKIPFVVTSKEWQEYYKRKEEKKKELEKIKTERVKLRQERAEKKARELDARRKKRKEKKQVNISEEEDDTNLDDILNLEDNTSTQKNLIDRDRPVSVNSYVIIVYEEEYFPGVVLEKKDNGANVKVMAMAGPDTWKWPEKDDILFYVNEDILAVIDPPELKNTRGHYYVPEIIKFCKNMNVC